MLRFRPKTIQGVTYTLDHLEGFTFTLDTEGGKRRAVIVGFSCHCFTEDIRQEHTPDYYYVHGGEKRAFDLTRHALSKRLPEIIRALYGRTVYMSKEANYFLLRTIEATELAGPYLVFFNVRRAKQKGVDVLMNVESAYLKPGMTDRASAIRFSTLIERTATGKPVPRGPLQLIKRK